MRFIKWYSVTFLLSLVLGICDLAHAQKVVDVSQSVQEIELDPNYKYRIVTRQGTRLPISTASNLQSDKGRVIIQSKGKQVSLLNEDILKIEGVSRKSNGTYAGRGFVIGAIAGGVLVGVPLGVFFLALSCEDDACSDSGAKVGNFFSGVGIGTLVGALPGFLMGSAVAKRDKIRITPIFGKGEHGIQAGAKLSLGF